MTVTEILPYFESVRPRGPGKWIARCVSHEDHSPSLSITEGEKGVLLKCWAGCSLEEITGKLGIQISDLFFDALSTDPHQRREALQRRSQERAARTAAYEAHGRRLDALREAENLIQSAQGISIAAWSDEKLDATLERLADAYALIESEGEQ